METLPVNYVAQMSEVLKLLGNVQRLRIIEFLDLRGESAVSEIVEGVAGRQGAVSQDLNLLRRGGLISRRRSGRRDPPRRSGGNFFSRRGAAFSSAV